MKKDKALKIAERKQKAKQKDMRKRFGKFCDLIEKKCIKEIKKASKQGKTNIKLDYVRDLCILMPLEKRQDFSVFDALFVLTVKLEHLGYKTERVKPTPTTLFLIIDWGNNNG